MLKDKTSIENTSENQKVTMVYPTKKGKRIALYFCDLVICFFISYILFIAAVFPLSKLATNYNAKIDEMNQAMLQRDSVLEYYNLLHYEKYNDDFDTKLNKTFVDYLKEYTFNTSPKTSEVFSNYYIDVLINKDKYYDTYTSLDKDYHFLDIDKTQNKVELKEVYRTEFKAFYDEHDTPSEQAKKDYEKFRDKIFAQYYSTLLSDVYEKDLSYVNASGETISYKAKQSLVNETIKYTYLIVAVDAYIAFALSWGICYVLIPFLHPNRKTASLFFLSLERVDKNTLMPKKRAEILPNVFYSLASNMWCILFIPLGSVAFNELFVLPTLWPIALVSVVFVIISFIYTLFDEFNRPLSDALTRCVVISNDDLDEVCRQKGYLKDGK